MSVNEKAQKPANQKGNAKDEKPDNNAAKFGGLMRSNDVKIGAIGPDGNVIESNGDVKRIRSYLQTAQKALKAGQPIPPYVASSATDAAPAPAPTTTPTVKSQGEKAKKPSTTPSTGSKAPKVEESTPSAGSRMQFDDAKKVSEFERKSMIPREKIQKQHPLFAHIAQYERAGAIDIYEGARRGHIHSSVLALGHAYASGIISGTTARTMALADALLELITDFEPSKPDEFIREFPAVLNSHIRFLIDCRQMAIPMGNLVRYIKHVTASLTQVPDAEARAILHQKLSDLRLERIQLATCVLADHGQRRITDGDVILVYSFSRAVESVLVTARNAGKNFSVIVVDARPMLEGKQMLERLVLQGLDCKYTLIHSAAYIMRNVTKVFLGASAMLSNGSLLARAGSAVIAMIAKTSRIPVLVCCETFKFSERVQLDSICDNEIGSPDELTGKGSATTAALNPFDALCQAGLIAGANADNGGASNGVTDPRVADWRNTENLKLLNITYDVTPIDFLSCVVTEMGVVPPTSVPVILREFNDIGF